MLIVTQTGAIVNFDRVETVFTEPEAACFNPGWNIFARGVSGKSMTLGCYENETRAREILQEIVGEYICSGQRVYRMP